MSDFRLEEQIIKLTNDSLATSARMLETYAAINRSLSHLEERLASIERNRARYIISETMVYGNYAKSEEVIPQSHGIVTNDADIPKWTSALQQQRPGLIVPDDGKLASVPDGDETSVVVIYGVPQQGSQTKFSAYLAFGRYTATDVGAFTDPAKRSLGSEGILEFASGGICRRVEGMTSPYPTGTGGGKWAQWVREEFPVKRWPRAPSLLSLAVWNCGTQPIAILGVGVIVRNEMRRA